MQIVLIILSYLNCYDLKKVRFVSLKLNQAVNLILSKKVILSFTGESAYHNENLIILSNLQYNINFKYIQFNKIDFSNIKKLCLENFHHSAVNLQFNQCKGINNDVLIQHLSQMANLHELSTELKCGFEFLKLLQNLESNVKILRLIIPYHECTPIDYLKPKNESDFKLKARITKLNLILIGNCNHYSTKNSEFSSYTEISDKSYKFEFGLLNCAVTSLTRMDYPKLYSELFKIKHRLSSTVVHYALSSFPNQRDMPRIKINKLFSYKKKVYSVIDIMNVKIKMGNYFFIALNSYISVIDIIEKIK